MFRIFSSDRGLDRAVARYDQLVKQADTLTAQSNWETKDYIRGGEARFNLTLVQESLDAMRKDPKLRDFLREREDKGKLKS